MPRSPRALCHALAALSLLGALLPACADEPRSLTAWSRRFGGPGEQSPTGVAVDALGRVTLAGVFTDEIDFGGGALTGSGDHEIFVAQFDDQGRPRWSGSTGSFGSQAPRAVVVAPNGDVLVAGSFENKIGFGAETHQGKQGTQSGFLARFDAEGTLRWSLQLDATTGRANIEAMAVNDDGSALVIGEFYQELAIGDHLLDNGSGIAGFVARLSSQGKVEFAQGFRGPLQEMKALAVERTGAFVVVGDHYDTLEIGSLSLQTENRAPFLARFDPSGKPTSLIPLATSTSGAASVNGVAVDAAGGVVVTGEFEGVVDIAGETLASIGFPTNAFIAKLDHDDRPLWAKSYSGNENASSRATAVALDLAGQIVFTGSYSGGIDFGGGPLSSTSGELAFLVELDPYGRHLESRNFDTGAQHSVGNALALDPEGSVIVAGHFNGSMAFDDHTLVSGEESDADVFLARLPR